MVDTKELFDIIKQSDITLIGYNFRNERTKDEFISNFNYVEIEEMDSSFSFKSFFRDLKIKSVLENTSVKNPEYILLDINNIRYNNSDSLGGRQKIIKSTIEKMRDDMYDVLSTSYLLSQPNYKVILTCPLYRSGFNSEGSDIKNFIGGSGPMFVSDLVITLDDNKIKVIKNRFGNIGDEILYNSKDLTKFAR